MEELSVELKETVIMECNISKSESNEELDTDKTTPELDSVKQISCQTRTVNNSSQNEQHPIMVTSDNLNAKKAKEISTGTKVKRKSRSTRRRLHAMVNNTSLHFSDTDSEGELITITSQIRTLHPNKSYSLDIMQGPEISVTLDDTENKDQSKENLNPLLLENELPRSSSFIDNLTDVDEIYASDPENDQKENPNNLIVVEHTCQGDTDFEDIEGDDEMQPIIYITSRSDIFCECSGQTITTKEGDGPFSIEIRNKLYSEEDVHDKEVYNNTPDIVILPNTDEEDMDMSEEEDIEEACCSQKQVLEDLDVLAASQIVMKNINKVENMLNIKDVGDDAISDCVTDTEDVD